MSKRNRDDKQRAPVGAGWNTTALQGERRPSWAEYQLVLGLPYVRTVCQEGHALEVTQGPSLRDRDPSIASDGPTPGNRLPVANLACSGGACFPLAEYLISDFHYIRMLIIWIPGFTEVAVFAGREDCIDVGMRAVFRRLARLLRARRQHRRLPKFEELFAWAETIFCWRITPPLSRSEVEVIAFDFVPKLGSLMFSYARTDIDDCRQLAAELVLVELSRGRAHFVVPGDVRGYFRRVGVCRAIAEWKARKREPIVCHLDSDYDDTAERAPSVEQVRDDADRQRTLAEALGSLSDGDRDALLGEKESGDGPVDDRLRQRKSRALKRFKCTAERIERADGHKSDRASRFVKRPRGTRPSRTIAPAAIAKRASRRGKPGDGTP